MSVENVLVLSDEQLAWIGEGLDVLIGSLGDDVGDKEHLVAARSALAEPSRPAGDWPGNGQPVTQVWCLPGTSRASLAVFSPEGDSCSVVLDKTQVRATIDALGLALSRMVEDHA